MPSCSAWHGSASASPRPAPGPSAAATESGRDSEAPRTDTPALAALDKARRRLRLLIADAMEGTDEEQMRLAEIVNRAADEALGKTTTS